MDATLQEKLQKGRQIAYLDGAMAILRNAAEKLGTGGAHVDAELKDQIENSLALLEAHEGKFAELLDGLGTGASDGNPEDEDWCSMGCDYMDHRCIMLENHLFRRLELDKDGSVLGSVWDKFKEDNPRIVRSVSEMASSAEKLESRLHYYNAMVNWSRSQHITKMNGEKMTVWQDFLRSRPDSEIWEYRD